MYIIIHEPKGKIIITDEMSRKFDEFRANGMDLAYVENFRADTFITSSINTTRIYKTTECENCLAVYLSDKKTITAAGGMVFNQNGALLMIYRKGMWDMPKGKLDDGETIEQCAIREVSEETGLSSISIIQKLSVTYHTYLLNGENIVKPSHWYEMNFKGNEIPKPQIEEDITEIRWVTKNEASGLLESMFPSIQEMVSSYYLEK